MIFLWCSSLELCAPPADCEAGGKWEVGVVVHCDRNCGHHTPLCQWQCNNLIDFPFVVGNVWLDSSVFFVVFSFISWRTQIPQHYRQQTIESLFNNYRWQEKQKKIYRAPLTLRFEAKRKSKKVCFPNMPVPLLNFPPRIRAKIDLRNELRDNRLSRVNLALGRR